MRRLAGDANLWSDDAFRAHRLILAFFCAKWCEPCERALSAVTTVAERYADKMDVVIVDVDENPATAGRYRVSIVPTTMFFRGGQKLHEMICLQTEADMLTPITNLIGPGNE